MQHPVIWEGFRVHVKEFEKYAWIPRYGKSIKDRLQISLLILSKFKRISLILCYFL